MTTKNHALMVGALFCLLANVVGARPNPEDGYGIRDYFTLHERGLYSGATIYSKDHATRYSRPGCCLFDVYLNQISQARYTAIDQPIRNALKDGIRSAAADEGLTILTNNAGTSGRLRVAFEPGAQNNTLTFRISGVSAEVHSHVKKSWYAEGWLHGHIQNITINGVYDYFNGDVTVTSYSAPIEVHVDIDLNIPILGDVLDFFIDRYVDDHVGNIPGNLNRLYMGGYGFSTHIGGIKDAIPLNKLIYNGVDYGAWLLNELATDSLINDNFSFTVGETIFYKQSFDLTVGNVTYTRWASGGTEICELDEDQYCEDEDY